MDMADMGMSGMGGMDMSGEGPFRPTNEKIARSLWYGITGIVGLLALFRVVEHIQSCRRQRLRQKDPKCIPSRPRGLFSQAYATVTATMRELCYPQPIFFSGKYSRYFSPLPIGRWLILVTYWTVLLCFLWTDTIIPPDSPMYGYKWEKVGFRAAWVSVSQIPFIYLLSCKFNPISILTGISYERFNWLHRWAARTVFLTVIVHWSFFFREWVLADFVALEIKMMPMVKYGFGAWSTIGWMVLSGFGFFRSLSYEIFVAQHICAAATLLWVLYTHVPVYARYNIYMAIGFLAFDWSLRIIWILLRNARGRGRHSTNTFGYSARLEKLPGSMVRLIIDDVDFEWRAGQHAYLSIPRLRPFEVHPFTIANAAQSVFGPSNRRLTLLVKAHSGFSKALYKAASKNSTEDVSYRTFLSGPWGYPPCLAHYDTVVLIGCTSGASFVIPLLDDLVREAGCARAIFLHWIIRSEDHLKWFRDELSSLVEAAQHRDLRLKVVVHVTNPVRGREEIDAVPLFASESNSEVVSMATSLSSLSKEKTPLHPEGAEPIGRRRKSSSISTFQLSRPSVESLIRPAVEAAHGETAIVVCGGHSITAQTRTFVSALSDERGVHKGSGAQGIFLFTETYGL